VKAAKRVHAGRPADNNNKQAYNPLKHMTTRQKAILNYHRDIAAFATNPARPVFVILDLDDSVGFALASNMQDNCAQKRDAIKASGAYPAFTLVMPVADANRLLADGWPNAKPIESIPEGMVVIMLISEERCLTVLVRKE